MTDRTFGTTMNCLGCRFWSEMIARAVGPQVEAICLSGSGELAGRYTTGRTTCASWKPGEIGAVDTPGFDGSEYADEPEVARP